MKKLLLVTLIVVVFLFRNLSGFTYDQLQVIYLDVGQGDATLVRTPDNFLVLIDAGPGSITVEKLSAFLAFNVNKLDLLIVTHFDADHSGGIPELQSRFAIDTIIYNKQDPNLKPVIRNAIEKIPKYLDIITNRKLQLGCCVSIELLWPFDRQQIFKDANMASLTFVLTYQNVKFFFSGDLPGEQERLILDNIPKISIFKVGHHGSATSTTAELVNKASPDFAVISVGAGNKYGHPSQRVLQLLGDLQIPFARTDLLGNIEVNTDGKTYQVKYSK
jgi:competence protein ComEC